ncbi:MAG TPA: histidinol-phosphate transaminase [Chromatiales bacterium]|nr:histidinol-phosphate transaminase [Thiotrichales bacterium]HIP67541.1 histidinol-phosphate transaminase [Chromatiales bacterium]
MSCDFVSLALSGVQHLKPYQPGKPIKELERELGISNSLKLASNENPLGPSPFAVEALKSELTAIAYYPDGNGFALKKALADKLDVAEAAITLGNGSNEILELVARTFLAPGREVIFSEHAFAVYPIVTQAVGATAQISAANSIDHAMPYGHDLDAMQALINDKTRVIFVANPNNPTGTWLRSDELENFIQGVPENIIVVIDEAYFEYVEEDEYPDSLQWVSRYPNIIVTRTFSKIYGLAGLRIGYSISSPEVADLLNRVRQPFNTNSLAQAGAVAALADNNHVLSSVKMNREGLAQLQSGFAEMGLSWIPSVANFISVNLNQPGLPVYQKLLHEGVIVRPVDNYGLPDYLRITVGRSEQNERVIQALKKVIGK